jgi:hypothetical protein
LYEYEAPHDNSFLIPPQAEFPIDFDGLLSDEDVSEDDLG